MDDAPRGIDTQDVAVADQGRHISVDEAVAQRDAGKRRALGTAGQVIWIFLGALLIGQVAIFALGLMLARGGHHLPHMIAQWIGDPSVKYNADNIIQLGNWESDPAVLLVPKDSPFKTVDDLVAHAKANPGRLTVSGAGLLTGHHIAAPQFEKAAGVKFNFLPAAQGGVQALQFVIGGQVQAGFNNLSDVFRNQDQLRVLGIAAHERDRDFLSDVPTFKEAGLDIDDTRTNLRGIAARLRSATSRCWSV